MSTETVARDRMDDTPILVPPGLANVVVSDTELGDVRGLEGFYHYRGFPAVELAQRRSFEDVWHLMLFGHLPDDAESARFAARCRALRILPAEVTAVLPQIARSTSSADPLAGLRAALTLTVAVRGGRPLYDLQPAERLDEAIAAAAVTPTLLAALHRLRHGEQPVEPRADLDTASNWLCSLTGEEPSEQERRAINAYLVSTIDHGFNASTFTARVVASTGTDLGACVVAALGALAGPLHGGAPSRALELVDEVGSADRVEAHVRAAVQSGGRIMGFGHPIYRTEDPRSRMLKEVARGFGGPRVQLAIDIEAAVLRTLAEVKPGRALHTNVEYYAAMVMERCGIPRELFTATFAVARVVGWTAHILEQVGQGKILRPSSRYVGPEAPRPLD